MSLHENLLQSGGAADFGAFGEETGPAYSKLAEKTAFNGKTPVISMENDFIQLPGQNFTVVSFVDASQYGKLRVTGSIAAPTHLLKIRGVFKSATDAERHVAQCQKLDPYFDFHIIQNHQWSTIGAFTASEQRYDDDTINEVMGEYFKSEDVALSDLKERIALAKDSKSQRAPSTTEFWESSQSLPDTQNSSVGTSEFMNVTPGEAAQMCQ